MLTIIYSFGEISTSSSPVAIVVEVKDQITSASGVSEKAELTVIEVLVKLSTGLLSTLTDSDQYNCTKVPESSFVFAAFSKVSIAEPLSSKRTKSPRVYAVELIVAFSCCKYAPPLGYIKFKEYAFVEVFKLISLSKGTSVVLLVPVFETLPECCTFSLSAS